MSKKKQSYSPDFRVKNDSRKRLNKSVDESFIPDLDCYLDYLREKNLSNSKFSELFNNFKSIKVNLNNIKYEEFLQYLIDEEILEGNRELYSHLKQTLEYFVENNMLHINKKNEYLKILTNDLFSKNQDNKIEDTNSLYKVIDYSQYENSDFREVYNDQVLNELFNKGGEIFLTNNSKVAFKLSRNDTLKEYSIRTAEKLLSKYFKFNIEITDDVMEYNDIDYEDFIFQPSEYTVINIKEKGVNNG